MTDLTPERKWDRAAIIAIAGDRPFCWIANHQPAGMADVYWID
jgi:hypothetical protein